VIAVTTQANIELLRDELGRDARSVKFIQSPSFYSTPVASLAEYRSLADAHLERGIPWVRVLGEPVWDGRAPDDVRIWTRYEALLNLVFASYPLTIVCLYNERAVAPEIVRQAHLTHPNAMGAERHSQIVDYDDPARFALEP
jgi:hypothetical protein